MQSFSEIYSLQLGGNIRHIKIICVKNDFKHFTGNSVFCQSDLDSHLKENFPMQYNRLFTDNENIVFFKLLVLLVTNVITCYMYN